VGGCESDTRLAVVVVVSNNPVTSAITGISNPLCEADNVIYSVEPTTGSSYMWTVPSGSTILTGGTGPDNHTISVRFATTSGPVSVTETNQHGCIGDPVGLNISLVGCNLEADFVADVLSICQDGTVVYTNQSQGTTPATAYEWRFGEGAVPLTATGIGPHPVVYTTPGDKTVTLIIQEGLTDTTTLENIVRVYATPVAQVSDISRCGPGSLTFNAEAWHADAVAYSLNQGIDIEYIDESEPYSYAYQFAGPGSVIVWVRALNQSTGCAGEWDSSAIGMAHPLPVTETIQAAHLAPQESGYVDIVCSGRLNTMYYVDGDGNAEYNWVIEALGLSEEGTEEIIVDWNLPAGDYPITVQKISPEGCAGNTRDTLVKVSEALPDLGDDISICEGQSHTFETGEEFISYLWQDFSTGSTFVSDTTQEIWVEVYNEYECKGSDTVDIVDHPNPVVFLGKDTILCGDNSLEINAGDFESFAWSTGQTVNPIFVLAGAGNISVRVTDEFQCEGSDEILILECDPESLLGVIPNTITPDGDGVHDQWVISRISLFPDASVQIFDRWGRLIYEKNGGYENEFNGKGSNGKELPVDTYYYIIDLKEDGEPPITGNITIIR